jgi:hypothetical protein
VELLVGEVDEGACFTELFLDGLVPNAFSLDMSGQAFGQEVYLFAEVFGQHARMAFDLCEAVIDSLVDLHELPVN